MCRDGEDHRSLAQLLKDLEKRVEGDEPAADIVGSTVSRPLHVVLQVTELCIVHLFRLGCLKQLLV